MKCGLCEAVYRPPLLRPFDQCDHQVGWWLLEHPLGRMDGPWGKLDTPRGIGVQCETGEVVGEGNSDENVLKRGIKP